MKEVAALLIDFGIDFQYENNCSEGDYIISHSAGIEVFRQSGKLTFVCEGQRTVFDDSQKSTNAILDFVEQACIEETTF